MRRQGEKIMANLCNNPSMKLINQFHDDHKWRQFHNAKDLAPVSIEAAELLEIPMD